VLLKDKLRCRLCDRSLLSDVVLVLIGGSEGCLLAMARRLVALVLVFWGVLVVLVINEIFCCCGEEVALYELFGDEQELAVVGLPVVRSPAGLGLANPARGGVCGEDGKCGGGSTLLSIAYLFLVGWKERCATDGILRCYPVLFFVDFDFETQR
jgi:hypothetical protein